MVTYRLSPKRDYKVGTLVLDNKHCNFHSVVSASKAIGLDPSSYRGKRVTRYSYTLRPPCRDTFVHVLFYQGTLVGAFAYPKGLVGGVLPLTDAKSYCEESEPPELRRGRSLK